MLSYENDEPLSDLTARHRALVLTIWQDTPPDFSSLDCDYTIAGKEIAPTTKRVHQQCYLYRKKRVSFAKIKKLFPTAYVYEAKGNALQNQKYCSKDGEAVETGILPSQGRRNDIGELYKAAASGKSDIEIGEEHPSAYMKYYKAVDRVRFNYARTDNAFSEIEVLVFVGEAGAGKTRKAFEIDPNLYMLDYSAQTIWFDGYQDQDTLLIDDFYGTIKYSFLLKLLDGYKFQLPVKGGFTWKKWKRVIITSNKDPVLWYTRGLTPALARRISKTEIFSTKSEG